MTKQEILKNFYGHSTFRQGQEELIDTILSGKDALGIMPTGGGKSVCYQIPAIMMDGITIVISPLVSLMNDQVSALDSMGIRSGYINSSLPFHELRKVYFKLSSGAYKIIYVAPERLDVDRFLTALSGLDVSMVAVDEAHCVSQWGNDFRPSYLKIKEFISKLPRRPIVAAFTATATKDVRRDIISLLGLEDPFVEITGYDRPNLYFSVEIPKNKPKRLLELIDERKNKSGIVYCATRKSVESVCELLRDRGISAARYHAGLEQEERQQNQDDFRYDRVRVMVATNAFGMGIDKSNVSFVIHYNMPKSIEAYYQEAGRAGRDGEPADAIMLFSKQDIVTAKFLIENNENEELSDAERERVKRLDLKRLYAMTEYCETTACLRAKLLSYFDQAHPERCENCSNCKSSFTKTNVTREAQMILSCIVRINRRLSFHLGINAAINVLRGSKEQRILDYKLNELSTYGIAKDISAEKLHDVADYLIKNSYIIVSDGQYPSVDISEKAMPILKGREDVFVFLRKQMPNKLEATAKAKAVYADNSDAADSELIERLKSVRLELSIKEHVPAYIIFSNATLSDMALKEPVNMEEFLAVSGIGKTKAKKYGDIFIKAIADYKSKR